MDPAMQMEGAEPPGELTSLDLTQILLNTAFNMFPDSAAAQGKKDGDAARTATKEAMIFASLIFVFDSKA